MNSNTKLNSLQKSVLKDMKIEALEKGIQWADNEETTIAFVLKGNTIQFAISVTSPDEIKFRRKVGQYHAISRLMWDGEYTVMNTSDFYHMMRDVFNIPFEY